MISLLVVNIIPWFGIFFFSWGLFEIIIFYIIDTCLRSILSVASLLLLYRIRALAIAARIWIYIILLSILGFFELMGISALYDSGNIYLPITAVFARIIYFISYFKWAILLIVGQHLFSLALRLVNKKTKNEYLTEDFCRFNISTIIWMQAILFFSFFMFLGIQTMVYGFVILVLFKSMIDILMHKYMKSPSKARSMVLFNR